MIVEAGKRFGIERRGCADDARGLGLDQSVISELAKGGLRMVPPNKQSRIAGWSRLKSAMHAAKVRDPDAPWTMIHPRCRYTLETVAVLPRHSSKPEDCDTSANDHAADAWRYGMTYELGVTTPQPFLPY